MAKNTVKTSAAPAPKTSSATTVVKATPDIQAKVKDKAEAKAEAMTETKVMFKASQDRDCTLSDKVLLMVMENDKQWNDKDDDAKVKLLLLAEEQNKKIVAVDPGITALVALMDEQFHKEVATILAASVKEKTSAVDMLAQMRRVYTLTQMNGMALPGSSPLDGESVKDFVKRTGYRPDKVKDETAQGESITKVWTKDFSEAWPEVIAARRDLDDLAKEGTTPGSTRFAKIEDKAEIAAIAEQANQTIRKVLSTLRRAIKLHHRLIAIGKLNSIGIRFIPGTPKFGTPMPQTYAKKDLAKADVMYVTVSGKPLWMYNVADPSKGRDFSVTQVLAMKPENIPANGIMKDLLATAGKGTDEDAPDTSGTGEDMDNDTAQEPANKFVHFLSKTENRASLLKLMVDYKKNSKGADWIDTIQELDKFIHPMAEKTRNLHVNIQNAKLLNADNAVEETGEAA